MSEVVSFTLRPPARFDAVPWTDARVEEASTETGIYAAIDLISFGTVDPDPADPMLRQFTTANGTALDLWYRVVYVDGNTDESAPTFPIQNTELPEITSDPYTTTEELARILKIRSPTAAQEAALQSVLEAAAFEINAELGRDQPFQDPPPAIVVEVNLDRAVEHWQQRESPFGWIGLGESGPTFTARDSWERHAMKLSQGLKETWGIA